MSEYITIAGIVQFDPRTRQAGDKEVRDVVIRAIGSNKNFSVTLWPEKLTVSIRLALVRTRLASRSRTITCPPLRSFVCPVRMLLRPLRLPRRLLPPRVTTFRSNDQPR